MPQTQLAAVKALFFDVFGTLVDWRTSVGREAKAVLDAACVMISPGAPERDDFSSNRHPALAYCWSMIFSEKPGSTFRDHALGR